MEIVEYGRTELSMVRDHTDIPVRYKLERGQYTLFALVDKHSISPAVIFTIEGKSLIDASLQMDFIRCVASAKSLRPSEVKRYRYPEDGIRFLWNPNSIPPCDTVAIPIGDDRKIVISIINGTGHLVATERLQFDIKTNGTRRENDSL